MLENEALNTKVAVRVAMRPVVTDCQIEAVKELNLDRVKQRLMDPDEGLGWTQEQANHAEFWYKCFLRLSLRYPEFELVPTKAIDNIWHQHILDTVDYHEACENIFGFYLHHYPYFGMNGPEEVQKLEIALGKTRALFMSEFGKAPDLSEWFVSKLGNVDNQKLDCYRRTGRLRESWACTPVPACNKRVS